LRTLPGKLTEQSGYDAVNNWLSLSTSRNSPVKLVAAQNDYMVMGARRALSEKMHGEERERWARLPYLRRDACPQTGRKWVQQGLLTASVVLPPSAGQALELMAKALEGSTQPSERTLLTPVPFPAMQKLTSANGNGGGPVHFWGDGAWFFAVQAKASGLFRTVLIVLSLYYYFR